MIDNIIIDNLTNDFIWDIGRCAICSHPLSKDFPKDFPEDWKWCCSCVLYAGEIVEKGSVDKLLFDWSTYGKILISKLILDILYKIERKITLVS